MKTKPVLYDIDKETMANLYESGLSIIRLAKIYNVSPSSIYLFIKTHDIPRRTRWKVINIDKEEVVRLYEEEGLSIRAIALMLRVSYLKLWQYMKLNNIKTRNKAGNRMRVK